MQRVLTELLYKVQKHQTWCGITCHKEPNIIVDACLLLSDISRHPFFILSHFTTDRDSQDSWIFGNIVPDSDFLLPIHSSLLFIHLFLDRQKENLSTKHPTETKKTHFPGWFHLLFTMLSQHDSMEMNPRYSK